MNEVLRIWEVYGLPGHGFHHSGRQHVSWLEFHGLSLLASHFAIQNLLWHVSGHRQGLGAKVRQIRSSQAAIARPISSGLSSCTKWRPLTTTRCCLGKLLASLLIRPVMNTPGSGSIKSFGSDAVFSHA